MGTTDGGTLGAIGCMNLKRCKAKKMIGGEPRRCVRKVHPWSNLHVWGGKMWKTKIMKRS